MGLSPVLGRERRACMCLYASPCILLLWFFACTVAVTGICSICGEISLSFGLCVCAWFLGVINHCDALFMYSWCIKSMPFSWSLTFTRKFCSIECFVHVKMVKGKDGAWRRYGGVFLC
ncbi:uncharacterized protein EV420DRAFT_1596474 [Desarmillaria tabescens]|uniref:Uncharacterized protein n=1 Tax=Armillaria tabescens TaxID=1929756 RepID=A0AA39J333_ARMTA|nr:uncharacterized protein EV420DRAFT_1596474 [Desarmillaria tabescens]KAK0434669.1 hypothetical protein EV420DRAFT_1596474 [Desarmillaria tabescens]